MTVITPSLLDQMLGQFAIVEYVVFAAVAASGAITRYLWDCLRSTATFSVAGLLLSILFGAFIGNFVGAFLSVDYEYRDGILLLSGFVVKELLEVLHRYGVTSVSRFLKVDMASSIVDPRKEESKESKEKKRRKKRDQD